MENPHQKDSKIFVKYESVKSARSVGDAKDKGAKAWDLVDWHRRGSLQVVTKADAMAVRSAERTAAVAAGGSGDVVRSGNGGSDGMGGGGGADGMLSAGKNV
eukprot:9567129-Karenia_brevis.AAC.1